MGSFLGSSSLAAAGASGGLRQAGEEGSSRADVGMDLAGRGPGAEAGVDARTRRPANAHLAGVVRLRLRWNWTLLLLLLTDVCQMLTERRRRRWTGAWPAFFLVQVQMGSARARGGAFAFPRPRPEDWHWLCVCPEAACLCLARPLPLNECVDSASACVLAALEREGSRGGGCSRRGSESEREGLEMGERRKDDEVGGRMKKEGYGL